MRPPFSTSAQKIHTKCKVNRFEGVTLQLSLPSKLKFDFKMSPNSFTFTDDVASRAKTNNRVDDAENALTHAARNVKSKTLSAGGVGSLIRWFVGFGSLVDSSGCGDWRRQALTIMVEGDPLLVCRVCSGSACPRPGLRPVSGSKLTIWFHVEGNRIWGEIDTSVRALLRCTT